MRKRWGFVFIILILQTAVVFSATPDASCGILVDAVKSNQLSAVQSALQQGINPNCTINHGLTPAMLACMKAKPEMVKIMLEHGADVNQTDDFGASMLVRAAEGGNSAVVTILLNSSADVKRFGGLALIAAAAGGRSDIVKSLLDHGAPIYARSKNGMTALMTAAWAGDIISCQLLLLAGADPDIRNEEGEKAWQIALSEHHLEVAKILTPPYILISFLLSPWIGLLVWPLLRIIRRANRYSKSLRIVFLIHVSLLALLFLIDFQFNRSIAQWLPRVGIASLLGSIAVLLFPPLHGGRKALSA